MDFHKQDKLCELINLPLFKCMTEKNAKKAYSPKIFPIVEISGHTFKQGFEYEQITDKLNNKNKTGFILAFKNPEPVALKIANISEDAPEELKNPLDEGTNQEISIDCQSGILFYNKVNGEVVWIAGFIIDLTLPDLSKLPLVGDKIPSSTSLKFENLQFLFANKHLEESVAKTTLDLIPAVDLNDSPAIAKFKSLTGDIGQFNLSTILTFGDRTFPLTFTISQTDSQGEIAETEENDVDPVNNSPKSSEKNTPSKNTNRSLKAPRSPSKGTAKWFDIHKKLGPIAFNRAGIEYRDKYIWLLLDATFVISDLSLTLDGLGIGFDIFKAMSVFKSKDYSVFIPKLRLDGISLEYTGKGDIEISGAFLRELIKVGDKEIEQYSGAALVKTSAFSLSAIGSYAEINGSPSLFIYAFLDRPMGGPPCFFVTGLALGFGFNRDLKTPEAIDDIANFPLVRMVLDDDPNDDPNKPALTHEAKFSSILKSLQNYITPSTGKYFLAIGIKFTSFKLIDSFALLIANFGNEFKLQLLGISKLKITALPKGNDKKDDITIAQITIGLIAEFIPNQGILKVEGKVLPDSFILSKNCKLSGGFAFYTWFTGDHAGDFVLTVGGYHPEFNVPTHYPKVAPLALNWQVDSHLCIKGSAYFALTPSAIMAGGSFQARYEQDNLTVQFDLSADFLVMWQPLYYEINASVGIQASYSTWLGNWNANLGANLNIWGPEFTGIATVSWTVIKFKVEFGNRRTKAPDPLTWDEFKAAFLPLDNNVCTITPKAGLLKTIQDQGKTERWIVEPKNFCIAIESAIPIIKSNRLNEATASCIEKNIGIRAMGTQNLNSYLSIKINESDVSNLFDFYQIYKAVPAAIWDNVPLKDGKVQPPSLNNKLIPNVLCGFEVKLRKPIENGNKSSGNELKLDKKNVFDKDYRSNEKENTNLISSNSNLLQDLMISEANVSKDDFDYFNQNENLKIFTQFLESPSLVRI